MLKVINKGYELFVVSRLDKDVHVVEHYTDGFYPDPIVSGSIVQKSKEKDIHFGPVEQDVPIECLKKNVMGAAVTK